MRIAILVALGTLGCGARSIGECTYCDNEAPVGDATTPGGDGSIIGRDDGVVIPDAPFAEVGPQPATCPKTLPKDNAPCSGSDVCTYAGCDPRTRDTAACVSGRWNVVAHACTSDPERCPATVPVDNSPCALPGGMFCVWDETCIAGSRGQCVSGRWQTKHGGCGGPDLCPPTMPAKGTTCPKTAPGTGFGCTYRNACAVPTFSFCSDSTWGIEGHDDAACAPEPDCPSTLPAPNTGCAGKRICVYPNECGSVDYAQCSSGTWFVSKLACPDFECPPTPDDGTKCSVAGQTCVYPGGRGCSIGCTCSTSSGWSCAQQPCGTGMGGGGK